MDWPENKRQFSRILAKLNFVGLCFNTACQCAMAKRQVGPLVGPKSSLKYANVLNGPWIKNTQLIEEEKQTMGKQEPGNNLVESFKI